jgi:site-specific DNA-methyltransferase (adenine-specific)/site-specific DNA-methyltransferase (cytosine-N4-specific)
MASFAVANKKLHDLKPDTKNANKGTERGQQMIEASLRSYGAGRSILIDKNGRIIAGNKTAENFGSIGLEDVLVVQTDGTKLVAVQRMDLDLNDKAAQELAIADNRAGQVSLDWDIDVLKELDVDLAKFWSEDELAVLLADKEPAELLTEEDDVPPVPSEPETVLGDLYVLGNHRLLCGDSRAFGDVVKLMNGRRINVAVTSPPYASQRKYDESSGFKPIPPDEYVEWYREVAANIAAHLAEDGSYFCNIKEHCEDGQRSLYVKDLTLAHVRDWGWRFVDEFCWVRSGVPGKWPNRFKNGFEPVFHFCQNNLIKFHGEAVGHESDDLLRYSPSNPKTHSGFLSSGGGSNGRVRGIALPNNVLDISTARADKDRGHTAEFPVALPEFFIKAFSDKEDAIFDPFMGSGTTLMAAEKTGRCAYGTEISPAYCDVIVRRWEEATGKKAVRHGTTP